MNLFTFPFYPSLDQQSRFQGCGQVKRALLTPQSRWLPFVLQGPVSGDGLDCVRILRAADDTLYKTVASTDFSYDAFSDGDIQYTFYYGGIVAGLNMPCDEYYLEIGGQYSEVFCVVRHIEKYIKLQWRNPGGIYQTGFFNLLYLDAVIAEPQYPTEEEGEEDAEGNFFPLRVSVEKTLKFDTDLLPEYLVDALAGIPLHKEKQIGRYHEARNVKIKPEWNKAGCAASVEVTFADGAALTSEGCGAGPVLTEVDLSGFVASACDGTGPIWADAGETRCEQSGGNNTGWVEKKQIDNNPLSASHNQARWIRTQLNTTTCPLPAKLLKSRAYSDQVYRTNCDPNEEAGFVTYTVPEGKFEGYDQAVIDKQAFDFFEATKELYANSNAVCIPKKKVFVENIDHNPKAATFTLRRSDTVGELQVTVEAQCELQLAYDGSEDVRNAQQTFIIPAGQSVLLGCRISFGGDIVRRVQYAEVTSTNPSDYSY
jgi:hypothetical protein